MRRLAPAATAALVRNGDAAFAINFLEKPDSRLGPDPLRARQELFRSTLEGATAELTARLGADPAQWRWGRLLHAFFEHPSPPLFPTTPPCAVTTLGQWPKRATTSPSAAAPGGSPIFNC
jgi:acyl-homoserine lactone acylase PvdQ